MVSVAIAARQVSPLKLWRFLVVFVFIMMYGLRSRFRPVTFPAPFVFRDVMCMEDPAKRRKRDCYGNFLTPSKLSDGISRHGNGSGSFALSAGSPLKFSDFVFADSDAPNVGEDEGARDHDDVSPRSHGGVGVSSQPSGAAKTEGHGADLFQTMGVHASVERVEIVDRIVSSVGPLSPDRRLIMKSVLLGSQTHGNYLLLQKPDGADSNFLLGRAQSSNILGGKSSSSSASGSGSSNPLTQLTFDNEYDSGGVPTHWNDDDFQGVTNFRVDRTLPILPLPRREDLPSRFLHRGQILSQDFKGYSRRRWGIPFEVLGDGKRSTQGKSSALSDYVRDFCLCLSPPFYICRERGATTSTGCEKFVCDSCSGDSNCSISVEASYGGVLQVTGMHGRQMGQKKRGAFTASVAAALRFLFPPHSDLVLSWCTPIDAEQMLPDLLVPGESVPSEIQLRAYESRAKSGLDAVAELQTPAALTQYLRTTYVFIEDNIT